MLAVVLLTAFATFRITASYRVLSQTIDEPANIAAGLELLQMRKYALECQHPPLARLAVAVGPHLLGARLEPGLQMYPAGNLALGTGETYWRRLAAARAGNLVFFWILSLGVAWWAWRWAGGVAAVAAAALVTSLPPILGHAGQATTDLAAATMFFLAFVGWHRYFVRPGLAAASLAGALSGLAAASKFSTLPMLAASIPLLFLCRRIQGRDASLLKAFFRHTPAACAVALVVLWVCYLCPFEIQPALDASRQFVVVNGLVDHPLLMNLVTLVGGTPVPFYHLPRGLFDVALHNYYGHPAYLLGNYSRFGWWYFFPVVLAVKTPLSFLGLAAVAWAFLLKERRLRKVGLATLAGILAVLAPAMAASVNIGVRHILAVYTFPSVAAGIFLAALAATAPGWRQWLAVVLCLLPFAETAGAGVRHLSWFNRIAGDRPEKILIDSDLDWGQDFAELALYLNRAGIQDCSLAIFTSAEPEAVGLPSLRRLDPYQPQSGCAAVSVRKRVLDPLTSVGYRWLREYTPVRKLGDTIYLYEIPPAPGDGSQPGRQNR